MSTTGQINGHLFTAKVPIFSTVTLAYVHLSGRFVAVVQVDCRSILNCVCVVNNSSRIILLHSQFVLIVFSLTVKAATLIFIYGRGSAISSAKEGKSGFFFNLVKS